MEATDDQQPTRFELVSPYQPAGDQPKAIEQLVAGLNRGDKHQVLLGATGTGKTYTIAQVVAEVQRPTLVLAHNKTLAAQLYGEFKSLFPHNAVEYFVSYYDYYQPEAYVPSTDTFIEKDSAINEEIDRLRHSATRSLLERRDVLIVASVSCIYGLGSAETYYEQLCILEVGQIIERDAVMARLVDMQYDRNDIDFHRGTFRVRGDVVEVFPVHEDTHAVRIEFFGDEIESIQTIDPMRGRVISRQNKVAIYPASHYVADRERASRAVSQIREELQVQLAHFQANMQLLEAQRIEQRTLFDLESIEELGFCPGIENYSRHFTGQKAGEPPPCLLNYFPEDWLLVVDESHATLPQVGGMYKGDRSRKQTLVQYGFRLPSALDNRPLKFEEFEALCNQAIYVSATPANYELEQAGGVIVEQIIRPTGLCDPVVEVRPATHQVDDLLGEVRKTIDAGWRVLVTTLTKRMAEDLTDYYREIGIKVRYLHSDIDTLERSAILRDLRRGEFDVLVGINLLREGLDLPEVGLVGILDADKEGFLRNQTSLIQTIGRAARNAEGRVILYADRRTKSIERSLEETERRRAIQQAYNQEHNITPRTVQRQITDLDQAVQALLGSQTGEEGGPTLDPELTDQRLLAERIKTSKAAMLKAAQALDFEQAARLRDELRELERIQLALS